MIIKYIGGVLHYYDKNGNEIFDGDEVILDGARKKVYRTENDFLGTDATNPAWIESGRAAPCEFGIYQFEEGDDVEIVH